MVTDNVKNVMNKLNVRRKKDHIWWQ